MADKSNSAKRSAFEAQGLKATVGMLMEEIRDLYMEDKTPWVIGYSGGKDSSAVLHLVWNALQNIPAERRDKGVHVISTDTLVENPIVASWVTHSLQAMEKAAEKLGLPIKPHRLTPAVEDRFWTNLIGKGYPSPRNKFRWCTERLKIKPSNGFIISMVSQYGETILVLGTRKAESAARARVMERHQRQRVRERLSPNASLPNSLIYSPIEDWTSDDVWLYLLQTDNPWGINNKDLLTMYRGASPDSECPLVVDSTTPSCGDSRFGCWVCTMVEQDKSMQAMIQNDIEKEWMQPLLELRNELDDKDVDRKRRDFRRMTGIVQLFNNRAVHGPYTQEAREYWLRRVLDVQKRVRSSGPQEVSHIELVSLEELREIRRIWVVEKHEIEDSLPAIYKEVTGEAFPDSILDESQAFSPEDIRLLRQMCGEDGLHFQMVRELLDVESRYRNMVRRSGLFDALEKTLRRHFYEGEEDAVEREIRRKTARDKLSDTENLFSKETYLAPISETSNEDKG